MALDIPIPNSAEETITKPITTDTTRVETVIFNFNDTTAIAFVAFGNMVDGEFVKLKSEQWGLSGEYYQTAIMALTSGKPIAQELLTNVAGIVTDIQTTEGKKQTLLDSGELTINSGNFSFN